jgi:indolepyruvate ferredoxin oxidoreductase
MSHVRISNAPNQLHPARIGPGEADLILGCDLVVAVKVFTLDCIEPGKTRSIVNSHLEPTAAFVADNDLSIDAQSLEQGFRSASRGADTEFVDATSLATTVTDDSIFANVFLLGYACQRGLLPVGILSIERAIEMNGVEVDTNKRAFTYGRLAAHDRTRFDAIMPDSTRQPPLSSGLTALVEHRATHLSAFQNDAYARHYRDFVDMVFEAEKRHSEFPPMLAEAVAVCLFKLMAYKDEYEVARLYTDGVFLEKLKSQFAGDFRLEIHLAPRLLARRDPETRQSRKRTYGPWMFLVLAQLAKLKWLRGTRFDPFGHTAERRMERRLIAEYEAVVREIIEGLTPANHSLVVEIARIPEGIRGFGHVKQRSVEQAKAREAVLLGKFRTPLATAKPPELLPQSHKINQGM